MYHTFCIIHFVGYILPAFIPAIYNNITATR